MMFLFSLGNMNIEIDDMHTKVFIDDEDVGADLGDGLHLHKVDLVGHERFHLLAHMQVLH
jgi:hypothetical protein